MGIFIGLTFIGLAMGLAHIADRQADAVWRYLGSFVLAALWLIIADVYKRQVRYGLTAAPKNPSPPS